MFSSSNCMHLPSTCLIFRGAVIILLIFFVEFASSNKGNFNSKQHKTKEAESRPNDLNCYYCDMLDGDDCLNINQTKKRIDLSRKCSDKELFCSVKRFSYTMSDKNSTSEKKLWSIQRNCSETCENECIIIGERMKLHACQTCCTTSYCNVGSHAIRFKFDTIPKMFSFLFAIYANFS